MSNIHELLKRLHSTNEGETICLNYEEVQYVLQMERIIEDQEKKIETTEGGNHGHWIIDEYEYLDCSCCGESYYTGCDSTKEAKHRLKTGDVYKFCPYCGARMDGGQE